MVFSPFNQMYMRPTDGASIGLGVKAPIEWVVIFQLAGRAHREVPHGRLMTIIGHILNDRKTRSAVGTIDKRVSIAPISRIEQFTQTIVASGTIRRDECVTFRPGFALDNSESRLME